ncbi:hypothetical protein IE077_001058 [Cardiosporidium cionae]|uniref:Uncharacterized protein n=1 Tax=Cardiosporidium cionae TaxID=476202 RepID=A0ABQ7J621_9APIC|nr:hypothetical protein IE077_001058 [Cardiosporidium cionae]|eukprot:KAF8819413.1 hypothetical protein IE077_001058 [Cardiosporidium cionae]
MDPAARGLNEHLDLQACTLEEYNASMAFVMEEDAIMNEDVFEHLKKITSFQYNRCLPGVSSRSDFAATRALNREALNILVERYEGYAWLCEITVEIIALLDEETSTYAESTGTNGLTNQILYQSLCEQLVANYSTQTMREYMDEKKDHGSWNPPQFYWQLMKAMDTVFFSKHPIIVSTLLKLYHEKPKDEFLACWYQDYIHNYGSTVESVPAGTLSNEELSKLTSNFSVFTLRMSEEIRKYLLKDERTEFDDLNPENICQLFCYAENAYFYSQALLHFIIRWRPDLSGCRRLSQLLCKNIMDPPSYWKDINKREKEYSAAQLNLLMTNLCKYQKLYKTFRSVSQTQRDGRLILNSQEVCELYEILQGIVDRFESYQALLYERSSSLKSSSSSPTYPLKTEGHPSTSNSASISSPWEEPTADKAWHKLVERRQTKALCYDGFSIPAPLPFFASKKQKIEENSPVKTMEMDIHPNSDEKEYFMEEEKDRLDEVSTLSKGEFFPYTEGMDASPE